MRGLRIPFLRLSVCLFLPILTFSQEANSFSSRVPDFPVIEWVLIISMFVTNCRFHFQLRDLWFDSFNRMTFSKQWDSRF